MVPTQAGHDALGVDPAPRLVTLKVVEPPRRQSGVKVKDVSELVDKLKNGHTAGADGETVDLSLGRVTSFGASTISYEAYPRSAGTEMSLASSTSCWSTSWLIASASIARASRRPRGTRRATPSSSTSSPRTPSSAAY